MDQGETNESEASGVRTALLRGFVLLVLLMGGASAILTLAGAYRTVDELSRSLITVTTDRLEADLERFFAPARSGLRVLRELGRGGSLAIDDPVPLRALLMPLLADNPLVSSVLIANERGREFMLRRQPGGEWLVRRVGFEPGRAHQELWRGRDERLEAWDGALDYDPRTRPWFAEAARAGDGAGVQWTEPYEFFTTHEPGITASTAWRDDAGLTWVVAFDVTLSDISAFTRELQVSPRGRAFVLDREGRAVGLPDDPRLSGAVAEKAILVPIEELGIESAARAFEEWIRTDGPGSDVFSFETESGTWWSGFRRYPLSEERSLWITVTVPETDLLGDAIAQRNRILALTGVGLLLAIALGLSLDRTVRRRLEREVLRRRRVGRYRLEYELGRGGMGAVYRAQHALLRRPTAVKVLTDAEDEQAVQRFEREVQLTSELTHPNTIAIYDYGRTPDGTFYYAMEYLSGITLRTLVERFGPLPPERIIAILLQVCGSLAEAHARGMVHRDLKPRNLMLCERGGRHDVVKVLDFGLVKDLSVPADVDITGSHVIPGSPLFVSPEAVRSNDLVEARSDLYSLGAVGYFLLTGEAVFDGVNAWAVCMKHVKEPPVPPSKRVSFEVAPDLERVLMACLEKDPADRPASAVALAEQLEACASAGLWTEERAHAWWRDHMAELAALLAPPDERDAERALPIDLTDRTGDSW